MCSWYGLRVYLGTEFFLWSLLDELIMVSNVFNLIWVLWNGLGYLYELRDTNWEDMVDKLKL